jgi:hypothetical protein
MNTRTALKIFPRAAAMAFLGALLLTAGCASNAKTATKPTVPPSQIAVYESTDLLHSQYTLVQHVWLDSWRSNFSVPCFSTEAQGLEAMKRVASDAGANALLHIVCVDGSTKPGQGSGLYCYGDAIRLN